MFDARIFLPGTTRRAAVMLTAAAAAIALAACQGAPAPSATGTLVGHVKFTSKLASPIVVVAVDKSTGRVVHRAFLESNRAFRLPMDAGRYKFFAFADVNRDGELEPNEPVSVVYSLADEIRVGESLELPTLDVKPALQYAAR